MTAEVESLLATKPAAVAELARRLCALIRELYPDAVTSVDGNDIGFGSTAGYRGLVFTVSPHSKHVTLGIAGGAALPDPHGLLQGSGKVHRHVKLTAPDDVDRPELRELMAAAVAARD